MDSKPLGRDRRIRLQATNNFLRVKNINKGWDKVHGRRVEVLKRQLHRSRVALQREASLLEGEMRTARQDLTYLDDRDFQIKLLKRAMEKAKERKPVFLKETDALSTVALWSPRQQTSAGFLPRRQEGDGSAFGEEDGKGVSEGTSSLEPLASPAYNHSRSLLAPCRFYKAERRPHPSCRHFPCQAQTTYYGHDLNNNDISAQKSLASLGINPGLLARSTRTRAMTLMRPSSFQAPSAADDSPAVESGMPELVRTRMRHYPVDACLQIGEPDTQASLKEEIPAKTASQQRQSATLNNDDDNNCGNNFREGGHFAPTPLETGYQHRPQSTTLGDTTHNRTARHRKVSFSDPLSQDFPIQDELKLEISSKGVPFPGKHVSGVSKLHPSSDATDSKTEASSSVAPERASEILDDNNPFFKSKARSTAQRKTLDRIESLALAMDNQRRRNEENRPTPRETQYGQATPLRVLLKEGNPSVYAKMSGLCL